MTTFIDGPVAGHMVRVPSLEDEGMRTFRAIVMQQRIAARDQWVEDESDTDHSDAIGRAGSALEWWKAIVSNNPVLPWIAWGNFPEFDS